MALMDAVARELQKRYTFTEINTYLAEYQINSPHNFSDFSSKATYTKQTLRGVQTTTLLKIVEDLEINAIAVNSPALRPPCNWPDTLHFRLFISHIAKDKDKATRWGDGVAPA
jgi:hypothetical protein